MFSGSAVPMPDELMELYNLYQQELHTRQAKDIWNLIMRKCEMEKVLITAHLIEENTYFHIVPLFWRIRISILLH